MTEDLVTECNIFRIVLAIIADFCYNGRGYDLSCVYFVLYSERGSSMKKRFLCFLLAVVMLLSSVSGLTASTAAAEANENIPVRKTSTAMVNMLKRMEGFIKYPMWDYSQWTVGYGTRCPDYLLEHYRLHGITTEEATELLQDFLVYFENVVNGFAKKYGLYLTQNQFDALISFTYNCGGGWVNDEKGYLHAALRGGGDSKNIIYGLLLWCKAAGASILGDRRLSEANVYLNGVYKAYNESNAIPSNYRYVYLDGNGASIRYDTHGFDANDPMEVICEFTRIPTGVDANGNTFLYELDGWYTAPVGGTKVTVLDSSVKKASKLYAQWKDPNTGAVVNLVQESGDAPKEYQEGTVKGNDINCRSGAGTSYPVMEKKNAGDRVKIYEIVTAENYNWGRMEDGNWIAMAYVTLDGAASATTTEPSGQASSVELIKAPNKTQYAQGDMVELNGSILKVTYPDGTVWGKTINRDMIKDYVVPAIGNNTISVTYKGCVVEFSINAKGRVEFRDYDGKVLQSGLYEIGEAVNPPVGPQRPDDDVNSYTFKGWDKQVVPCAGNAVYTAVYTAVPHQRPSIAISMETMPNKTEYIQLTEHLDLTGAKLRTELANGTVATVDITPDLVTGFDNSNPGVNTLTVTYGGVTTTFNVTIVKPTITFLNYDGSVVSKVQYAFGEEVKAPADPQKPADKIGEYVFAGWDEEILPCTGNATYTATYKLKYATGDLDRNGKVDEADAIYLLRHILFPDKYAIYAWSDFDADGKTSEADAIYLLRHVLFADKYPLKVVA